MNFEHFVNTDGSRVCVNPALVAALESTVFGEGEGTRITTIGGAVFVVSGSVETVAARIQQASGMGQPRSRRRDRNAHSLERLVPQAPGSAAADLSLQPEP